MFKCLKKICALATITILLSQSVAFGATNKPSNESIYKNTALQVIKEMKSNKIIEGSIPLYNTDDVKSEILFELNSGYVIVDEATNTVSEFNLTKDNKYFNRTDEHYVYGGPKECFEEKGNKLINLKNNKEEKNKHEIEESLSVFRKNITSATSTITPNVVGSYDEVDIGGKLPNLSYNPNGVCGSCAVGNLLTFFSWNVSSPFVPQQYQSSVTSSDNGTQFIKSIIPYIEGPASVDPSYSSPGSSPEQLQTGLNNYLSNVVGYNGSVDLFDGQADPARVVGITNDGLPFILGLHSGDSNPYGDHWAVGIGYVYIDPVQSMPLYYKIIDGWGNNSYVNRGWSDDVVYLQL